jgi:hypothetical protein
MISPPVSVAAFKSVSVNRIVVRTFRRTQSEWKPCEGVQLEVRKLTLLERSSRTKFYFAHLFLISEGGGGVRRCL